MACSLITINTDDAVIYCNSITHAASLLGLGPKIVPDRPQPGTLLPRGLFKNKTTLVSLLQELSHDRPTHCFTL